jgi:amino acid transporter
MSEIRNVKMTPPEATPPLSGSAARPSLSGMPHGAEGGAQARFGLFGGVFTPCVLTILGVIMFMRAGFVLGHSGLWLGLTILGISKLITTLTTLSLSAIASNLKMRGGGVYFMISRVLGPDFGGSIGITLYFANAVGVAFYVIGFSEALFSTLQPALALVHLFGQDGNQLAATLQLQQVVSSLMVAALFVLTFKGADIAIKAQYVVLVVLLVAVASFLVGGALEFDPATFEAAKGPAFADGISFWVAFAIFFPAATGITAGANMSGDLKNPAKHIPWGTLLAILFTLCIYAAQLVLTAGANVSVDPEQLLPRDSLKSSPFETLQAMSLFAPLVVLGVFAATLSSALGSFLGAPRILQAMGQDRLMGVMVFFGKGAGETNEPRRATALTFLVAISVIWAGDLNAVAEVISMFFLIAYGMINLSAFVESKGGNPSFRPKFRFFHWSVGLAGAVGCAVAMLKINDTYAIVALAITAVIYFYLRKRDIATSYGDAKRGYIFQRTRDNLLYLEESKPHPKNWRPILVAVTENPVADAQLVRVGSWLESERGLYTVAQIVERPGESLAGKLRFRNDRREDLRRQLEAETITGFAEALVTEDFHGGLADFLQSYSLGGLRPNTVIIRKPPSSDAQARERFLGAVEVLASFDLNLIVLKPGDFALERKRRVVDLWWRGRKNGSLMALFAYLLTQNRMWSSAKIRFMRVVKSETEEREARGAMTALRDQARIGAGIEVVRSLDPPLEVIARTSGPADLVLLGMLATSGEEARRYLDGIFPLLEYLPTTLLVWSNGEADVFA